jgi:beta-1,2-mannobiose phosphorylase / 1,2-beta-oligomannan phosphorylase
LLLMVRVAESLCEAASKNDVYCIRWQPGGYTRDAWPIEKVDTKDPRVLKINEYKFAVLAVTSLSWLLPVELNADASAILKVHYDKIIAPQSTNQEYGIEDPRISTINGRFYMTTCCTSSERHSTMLFDSDDGLNYTSRGIILDHQNKDMLLFEGKIDGSYKALTRPLGECYFATSPQSEYHPGAAIHLATSPDLLHWKPYDTPFLRARRSSASNVKIGGGTPPVLTEKGWLVLYHGVENKGEVGIYRTFWVLLDKNDPAQILYVQDHTPLLESKPELTSHLKEKLYLNNVVFTTGMAANNNEYILASGECDLCCRITRIDKNIFNMQNQ